MLREIRIVERWHAQTICRDAPTQLSSFLAKFTPEIAARAGDILARMGAQFPKALQLVYDNYNALAIGFGPTERASEAVFSIAVFPRWVSLFFLQAKGLSDPGQLLKGSGSVAKHIVLDTPSRIDDPAIQNLIREALKTAKVALDKSPGYSLIIKSVSAKQRPRRPAEKKG